MANLVDAYPKLGTPEDGEYCLYPFARFKYSLVYFEDSYGPLILAVAPQGRELDTGGQEFQGNELVALRACPVPTNPVHEILE